MLFFEWPRFKRGSVAPESRAGRACAALAIPKPPPNHGQALWLASGPGGGRGAAGAARSARRSGAARRPPSPPGCSPCTFLGRSEKRGGPPAAPAPPRPSSPSHSPFLEAPPPLQQKPGTRRPGAPGRRRLRGRAGARPTRGRPSFDEETRQTGRPRRPRPGPPPSRPGRQKGVQCPSPGRPGRRRPVGGWEGGAVRGVGGRASERHRQR